MLSCAVYDLVVDPRSLGDIKQGVTTEIFGEGDSMGPLTDEMKRRRKAAQGDLKFEIEWTTLAEYLRYLEKNGHLVHRRFLHRRNHDSRIRDRPRRQESHDRTTGPDARAGSKGDGSRGARHRIFPHLCAGILCADRRTDRNVQSRLLLSRQIHLAYAQRRQSSRRSRRGVTANRTGSQNPCRDLSSESRRQNKLGKNGSGRRDGRKGSPRGLEDYG